MIKGCAHQILTMISPKELTYKEATIYLFKDSNRNTRKRCEVCWKLTILIVNFEHISHFFEFEQVNISWVKASLSGTNDWRHHHCLVIMFWKKYVTSCWTTGNLFRSGILENNSTPGNTFPGKLKQNLKIGIDPKAIKPSDIFTRH